MFANLKNKLIEEVKASKFQQFANAAQAAVSSSSSSNTPSGSESNATASTNENFFSITEEDTPQNSPYKPLKLPPGGVRGRSNTPQALNNGTGAISRTRKLSNSSMASDVSFRLPSYDSPAVYHLQSDWDASGSEMGDDSTSTAKLDVITKEQLYDAYKKSLDRYNKYRCRYTDLAKKYKDLEHDSAKARSVLVETQEKAIRRISELREQCTLEQQAKAHLEEALRIEMDDMQCKMQAYQTKLELLGENPENITAALNQTSEAALIDLAANQNNNLTAESAVDNGEAKGNLITLDSEMTSIPLDSKVIELHKQLQVSESELEELTTQLAAAGATIKSLKKQEEENALLLAQTKQAIHSELENKEKEVTTLNDNIKQLQSDLSAAKQKESQLTDQLVELKDLKEKVKSVTAARQESEAKLIASEHMLSQLKTDSATKAESLSSTEAKLAALAKDSEQKLQDLRQQNSQLNEMMQRYQQNEVSLAEIDNELNRTKNENDNLKATLAAHKRQFEELDEVLAQRQQQIETAQAVAATAEEHSAAETARLALALSLEEEHKTTIEAQAQRVKQLETEIRILSEQNASNESETVAALKEMHTSSADQTAQMKTLKDQLSGKEKELKATSTKLAKLKKQHETQQNKISEQNEELEKLRTEFNRYTETVQALEETASRRETQNEREKDELKLQIAQIVQEIAQMEEQMRVVQNSHAALEAEKRTLESNIENMQQQEAETAHTNAERWRAELSLAEDKLRQAELRLQLVESENSQLAEKNCLLTESTHRLEKMAGERERQQQAIEGASVREVRLQLESAEDARQKLNEKLSQVLDENSRMQNAQELMDHDHRTLQDKCDALEKEKLLALDDAGCLRGELVELKERQAALEDELEQATQKTAQAEERAAQKDIQLQELERIQLCATSEMQALTAQLDELKAMQSDDEKQSELLQQNQRRIAELQTALSESERQDQNRIAENEQKTAALKEQIAGLAKDYEAYEQLREEVEMLRQQKSSLSDEIDQLNGAREQQALSIAELQRQLEATERKCDDAANASQQQQQWDEELQQSREQLHAKMEELIQLQAQYDQLQSVQQSEISQLYAVESSLREELTDAKQKYAEHAETLESKLRAANADVELLHESNDAVQVEMDKLKSRQELQVRELEQTLKLLQVEHGRLQTQFETNATHASKLAHYEQLQIEREYLENNVRLLERQVTEQNATALGGQHELEELQERFKSLQCELYVLKENAEKHDTQMQTKDIELAQKCATAEELQKSLQDERDELQRQQKHATYITEQNDATQKELLGAQQRLSDLEHKLEAANAAITEAENSKQLVYEELTAVQVELAQSESIKKREARTEQAVAGVGKGDDTKHLRDINETLQRELEELKHKSRGEISGLQQEIEDLQTNSKHMMERMMQLESIRAGMQAQKLFATTATATAAVANDDVAVELHGEKAELETKLKTIMTEVEDVSNRNLFLEQKCENYLILEQSNERLRLQNAKLSRQLDETLVSMQHNEGVTANTEFEYLKNIMFQYFTGTANGNNETLVKVISAVLKFSPQQTQVALEKEHQRRSLINKIL